MRTVYVLLLATLFIVACSEEPPPPPVAIQPAKVFTVGNQSSLTRTIPGTVRAAQRSDLSFQVSGQIVEFDMVEGQQVDEGAVLARLDDRDFASAVAAARAERDKNQSSFDRAEELIKDGFISQADYDKLKATLDVSIANLQQADKALADTRLTAPFAGVVAKTFVQNFEDVRAKQPILSLQDSQELEIVTNISETLVARRDRGASLEIYASFDALPDRRFNLFIKEFAAEADPQTQTFEVVAGIEGNVANILPGMTATVNVTRLITGADSGPLSIPLAAVVAGDGSGSSVWKVGPGNKVQRQAVVTGALVGNDQIEVSSGLTGGDTIVVAGVSALTEGKEIAPITEVKF